MRKSYLFLRIPFLVLFLLSFISADIQAKESGAFSFTICAGYTIPAGDLSRLNTDGFTGGLAGDIFAGQSFSIGIAGTYSGFPGKKLSLGTASGFNIVEFKIHSRIYFANRPPNAFYLEGGCGFFHANSQQSSQTDFGFSGAFGRMIGPTNGKVGLLVEISTQAAADYSYIGLRLGFFTFNENSQSDDDEFE